MKFCRRVSRMSPPKVARQRRDLAHLAPAHRAEVNRKSDRVEARLLLLMDSHVIAFLIGQRHLGEIFERETEPRFDQLAKFLGPVIVDHELEPRLDPRDPILGGPLPDVDNRAHHRHRLLARDEHAKMPREPRRRGLPAADAHREALAPVFDHRDQRDAVNLGRVAVMLARGDGNLVLARQVGVLAIAVEKSRCLGDERGHVEKLRRDRRPRRGIR